MFWKALVIGGMGWFALLTYANSEIWTPAVESLDDGATVSKTSQVAVSTSKPPVPVANLQGPCGSPMRVTIHIENFRTHASRAMREDRISISELNDINHELDILLRSPIEAADTCQRADQLRREYNI